MNVYEARQKGREYCRTEGSEHYRGGAVEMMDLRIAKGFAEDYCIGNIVKYAIRFKHTQNPQDLAKAADYVHILCGVKVGDGEQQETDEEEYDCNDCKHADTEIWDKPCRDCRTFEHWEARE